MHEMSIIQSVLDALDRSFPEGLPGSPRRVMLEVGRLAQVNETLLEEAFAMASKEGTWQDAELAVTIVEPVVHCRSCDGENPFPSTACAACGSEDMEVTGGYELVVKEVEFDVEDKG